MREYLNYFSSVSGGERLGAAFGGVFSTAVAPAVAPAANPPEPPCNRFLLPLPESTKTPKSSWKSRLSGVFYMEQVKGIEPSCSAWEADILPLNYTCGWLPNYYSIDRLGLQEKFFHMNRAGLRRCSRSGPAVGWEKLCIVYHGVFCEKSSKNRRKMHKFIHIRKNTQEFNRKYSENCPCFAKLNWLQYGNKSNKQLLLLSLLLT